MRRAPAGDAASSAGRGRAGFAAGFFFAPLASSIDIWETQYLQILQGKDPVKEWTKGTWLKQFLDELDAAERPAFEEDYARRLRDAYPPHDNGDTLFPFRRLFIVVQR